MKHHTNIVATGGLVMITLFGFFSCKKDKGPITITPVTVDVVSYQNDIQPIFDGYCNGPGCHDLFDEAGQLNLTANVSYAELVNKVSFGFNPDLLVKPNDPAASVLLQKINSNSAYNPQMPLFAPLLNDSLIAKVEKWIAQGALNN